MNIAFTAKGKEWVSNIDPRFGRAEYILIYNDTTDEFTHFDNRQISEQAHGAGPQSARKLFELQADVLITGNGPGGNAATVLEKFGLKIFIGAGEMTVKQAFEAFRENQLTEFINQ